MKTILLIEDEAGVLKNTQEILQLSGYRVLTACNGKTGVETARAAKPDLILCNITMPELDGYGVLHLLNRNPATACIPFIFLTRRAEKADIQKAMILGADGYLIKPFDDLSLLELVEMRLQKTDFLRVEFQKTAEGLENFLQDARGIGELNRFLSEDRKQMHIKKKHLVYVEGDYPSAVYFIHKGKVKTFRTNPNGREYITELYKKGDFFGYAEMLENCNHSESAAAVEDTELYLIPRPDFNALLYHNFEVSNKFIKIIANELLEREERLLQLAYNSVRKRVADSLVLLHERYHEKDADLLTEICVTRDDLSNLAGASKETIIRTLSDFKHEKLIDISDRGAIRLLNLDKLRKLQN